jgi:ketosteroid isomerase-like protein
MGRANSAPGGVEFRVLNWTGGNAQMKYFWTAVLCALVCLPLPGRAQEQKRKPNTGTAALEKELFAVELKWMKAEFEKKTSGADSMGEMWTDDFLDILPGGKVVNKEQMMDQMVHTERQPGTGAFPDHFQLRAVYGNVALATDHTVIKGVDAKGKIVVAREMGVLRMFVKENGKWRVAGAGLVPIVPAPAATPAGSAK